MKQKRFIKQSTEEKQNSIAKVLLNEVVYVAGIGASAGGLEALERFLGSMPEDSGIAFIVALHLDPNHVSIMPELLQRSTKMQLYQAEDGMVVKPNHVYVTPANRDIAIFHGVIQLIEPLEAHGFRFPIDYFFKSLSKDFREKAICIILSGMASDGTLGLKEIKTNLGMVMVQEPKSAKYDGMPNSAINTGLADYVLLPEEMPEQLIKYISSNFNNISFEKEISDEKTLDQFQKIFIILRNHTGHDFSHYKQNTIFRRVEKRMNNAQLDTLPNYIRMLQENPKEIENLFNELLIGVTSFFRDPEAFEEIKTILYNLVKNKPNNSFIRIWVPGCSTGEEAYSIAIILRECIIDLKKYLNIQIFATDIDNNNIEKARLGTFVGIESEVSKERLKKFFISEGNIYHIRKEIREMLVFAVQSIIKDPPFTKLDLISCRNLLIYFNGELQKKIIPLFHFSLLLTGTLFLGSSETIGCYVDLFSIIDKKWKIYSRRDTVYSNTLFVEYPVSHYIGRIHESNINTKKSETKNISQLAEKIILKNCSPNCAIINENGDIIYSYGRVGKYLELPHGEAKLNIFEMACDGLQQELPLLVRKVVLGKKSLSSKGIKVKANGIKYLINISVKLIKEPIVMLGTLLIIFEEMLPQKKVLTSVNIQKDINSENIIKELTHELKKTKENLRATIEELETSNEELKSANEEMQSTNEEMQSSNEELETSKEELQSLNEELITVNTELQNKNDELSVVYNDMKNLLDGFDIPTIFLDNNLVIKRFTIHATKVINLIPSDVGRPITHISTNLKYEKLIEDTKEVLRTLMSKEIEIQNNDGAWYQIKILPYRTSNNYIDGVVITFIDISKLKIVYEEINNLNKEIMIGQEYANNIIDTVRDSLLILDDGLKVVSANRSFYKMFNTVAEKTVGKYIYQFNDNNWRTQKLRKLLEKIIPERKVFEDYEVEYNLNDGKTMKLLLNARQIYHKDNKTKLILLAFQYQNVNKG